MTSESPSTPSAAPGERAHVEGFYSRHPISAEHILHQAAERRGGLAGLRADDLFAFDQDHYGGLEAVDALATAAGVGPGSRVLDVCAGLAGPARYLAARYGASVCCVELNPDRSRGAALLIRQVGLEGSVTVVRADAMRMPLAAASFDVVVSQEALLHVPDKVQVIAEAARVLAPGGAIAFTDWVENVPMQAAERNLMWRGMAAQNLQTVDGYRGALLAHGFEAVSVDDLTDWWGPILEQRFAMYVRLGAEADAAGHPAGDDAFYDSYRLLVALVKARSLGGARFVARKKKNR